MPRQPASPTNCFSISWCRIRTRILIFLAYHGNDIDQHCTGPAGVRREALPLQLDGPRDQSMRCAQDFTAQTANTTLTIRGTFGKHYIGLDNVSVQCMSPFGLRNFCH